MFPQTISLDGLWDFFYSPRKWDPANPVLPAPEAFSGKMVTPGYWDDHYELFDEEDFFGLTARFNPDYRKVHFPMGRTLLPHAASSFLIGTGFYRKKFMLDTPFEQAILSVGPAMWGCGVYCNGVLAGQTDSYAVGSTFHLEKFLRPGEENELLIAVCNVHDDGGAYCRVDGTHDGMARGARAGQHRGLSVQGYQSERGGIEEGVSLKLCGKASIADAFISYENGKNIWHMELSNNQNGKLCYSLAARQGGVVTAGEILCTGNEITFETPAPEKRWSDRDPVLYDAVVSLYQGETLCDSCRFSAAPRTVERRGMQIFLNGSPVFLRGVTEHCYYPETTNPHFDKAKYLRDLGVLKAAGFNFIRCHTYCPPEPFFEACDELGILVQTELPVMWTFPEAGAILKMIRRHPSAAILCEGNEKFIDEEDILRLKKLSELMRRMVPGMLFNPQEAMRGVEYDFAEGQNVTMEPTPLDRGRLDKIREFSDCFGTLGGWDGFFSYGHDMFPGTEKVDSICAVYERPCLSHEIGILGGYLDFSLEERYKNTFIGTDLFVAAREHMTRHGVYKYAREYYEKNSLFISSVRKQLVENLRSCRNFAGFDYLGGIDTHWHLIGYPCGIFNEFYEEKFGETTADVRRYCGESVLLCSAGNRRNRAAGTDFKEVLRFSFYGSKVIPAARCRWQFTADGSVIASGENTVSDLRPGDIYDVAAVTFPIPAWPEARQGTLQVTLTAEDGENWENNWKFWIFPAVGEAAPGGVIVTNQLDAEVLARLEKGTPVLLTGNFPGVMSHENFRSHTSGRSTGHAGAVFHAHPVWGKFPHGGYLDWQFFPLMQEAVSQINDPEMPEFRPAFELIPAFKMVKRKSLLSEYQVGSGRLLLCGFDLAADDPAAPWMKHILLDYLADPARWTAEVPAWDPAVLLRRCRNASFSRTAAPVDAGGRPVKQ